MKRAIPVVHSLLGLAVLAWALAGQAQEMGGDACRPACEEERRVCVERCSEHDDPMECESDCDDRAQDCADRCRDEP